MLSHPIWCSGFSTPYGGKGGFQLCGFLLLFFCGFLCMVVVGWVVEVVVPLAGFLGGWLLVANSGMILFYGFDSHLGCGCGCSVWWVFSWWFCGWG